MFRQNIIVSLWCAHFFSVDVSVRRSLSSICQIKNNQTTTMYFPLIIKWVICQNVEEIWQVKRRFFELKMSVDFQLSLICSICGIKKERVGQLNCDTNSIINSPVIKWLYCFTHFFAKWHREIISAKKRHLPISADDCELNIHWLTPNVWSTTTTTITSITCSGRLSSGQVQKLRHYCALRAANYDGFRL